MTESEWRKRELDRWLAEEVMKRRMAMSNEERFHRSSSRERQRSRSRSGPTWLLAGRVTCLRGV